MKKILLIILAMLGSACEREPSFVTDADGVVTKMPTLWIKPQDDSALLNGIGNVVLRPQVVYKDYKLFGGQRNGEKMLTMRHIQTGEILWEWKDFLTPNTISFRAEVTHEYQNYLLLQDRDSVGNPLLYRYGNGTNGLEEKTICMD